MQGIVLASGEKVYAQNVLIASGAWSGTYGKEAEYYAHMEGIRGQALEVQSDTKLANHIIKYNKGIGECQFAQKFSSEHPIPSGKICKY